MFILIRNSLLTIFIVQVFSTVSFAVLYSSLSLYMTDSFNFSSTNAYAIVAVFLVYNYGLHMLGSYLGGLLSSYRILFVLGMIFQTVACFVLIIPSIHLMYLGLTLFLIGVGLNTPCLNMMITQRCQHDHVRRERAFMWNYAGSNIGFVFGYTAAGYFQLDHAYGSLFAVSSVFNIIALIVIVLGWRSVSVADEETPLLKAIKEKGKGIINKRIALLGIIFVALIPLIYLSLLYPFSLKQIVLIVSASFIIFFLWIASKQPNAQDKSNIRQYVILALFAIVFWSMYQLAPMGITLFAEHNVNMMLFGHEITPQWLGNINVVVITVGGFLLPSVFAKIRNNTKLTVASQFAIGILSIGIGLAFLPIGILLANAQGQSSVLWISLFYVFQSVGELMIAPIGYSMIAQLVPVRHQGLMMGTWMLLCGSTASVISSYLSGLVQVSSNSISIIKSNHEYLVLFSVLALITAIAAMLLYGISRKVKY